MLPTKLQFIIFVTLASLGCANAGFEGRPITNNISMPTGYTLYKGEYTIGIGPIAFGISDQVQIGTNALSFIFGAPNANVKVKISKNVEHVVAVGLDLSQAGTQVNGQDVSYVSWSPFLSYTHPMSQTTLFHAALNLSAFSGDSDVKNADPQQFWRGTSIDAGMEYSYSDRTKFLGEVGYDFTFSGPRLGGAVLWGWETFRLKLGVAFYDPDGGTNAFVTPVLGLWWRFGGN